MMHGPVNLRLMLLIDIRAKSSYDPDCLRVPRKVDFENYMKMPNEASHPTKKPIKFTVFPILKVSFMIVRKHTSKNDLEFLSFKIKARGIFIG